jgi:hypothetical protein
MADGDNKALVPVIENYAVMQLDLVELAEVVRENLGGSQIDIFQLDRVKVPAGGATVWQVPDLDAPKGYVNLETLEGILIYFSDGNGYWPDEFTGAGTPPTCSSEDGVIGHSQKEGLGGDCSTCPLNQFGSEIKKDGTKGSGKACKNMRRLFLLRPGNLLPMLVVAPPMSLKNLKGYNLRLASAGVSYWAMTTKLELETDRNEGGIEYSKIVPRAGSKLTPDEKARVKLLRDQLLPALQRVTIIEAAQGSGIFEDGNEGEATVE